MTNLRVVFLSPLLVEEAAFFAAATTLSLICCFRSIAKKEIDKPLLKKYTFKMKIWKYFEKILPFHTLKYWRNNANVFYTNMKLTFENIQSMLSQNHPFEKFLRILF